MRLRIALEITLVLVAAALFWAADRSRAPERTARGVTRTPEEPPARDTPARPAPEREKHEPDKVPEEPREIEGPPADPQLPVEKEKSRLGAKRKKSKWDPPADLAHLVDTPFDLRKEIDDNVATMMDYDAGRDSLDAKEELIAIGKPAFPRILGAMANIRDNITDVDNMNERLIESSLKLADEALREMDGWLTAKNKSTLRPGSEKRYIAYICRLHYKRWMQKLKDMPEMPGPFDPSGEYEGESEDYKGK